MARNTGDLQLDRADAFVSRERFVQRVGVGIMCVFVLAGAVGLFGQGALSHHEATSGNLTVGYERFSRLMLRNEITIAARVDAADGTIARISLDKTFLDEVSIEETRPPRVDMEIHESRIVFLVPVTNGSADLELHVEPQHPGSLRTSITVEGGGSTLAVRQFVFF